MNMADSLYLNLRSHQQVYGLSAEWYLVQKRHFLCFINWESNLFVPFGPA